jgi:hypothetical protein
MSTRTAAFRIQALPPDVLAAVRETGRDGAGNPAERLVAEVLAHPDVVQVHSRNVAFGCYMFTITRVGEGGAG